DIRAAAKSDCSIAYVGDAFELHYATSPCLDLYTETLRHNSPAGAYLTACVLYSSVFGKTVSRIDENGFLPAEDAALLRAEADASVFGSADAPASLISPKMPLFGYSYADERFAGEEYPANFDVLLSSALAYRQRGRFTQYDQLTTERATYTFSRRRTEPPYNRPEAATSQNKLYIDCSSFAFSTLLDAFDFNIGASRSKTLTFDVKPSANLLIPFEWCATDDGALSADAATALLLSTIRPGDVLSYSDPENNDGHTMLYIGNGQFIHCTGGSSFALAGADYDFTGLFDKQEIPAAVIFDNIDVLIKTYEPRYLFDTSKELTVRLLRPVYANLTPSARAVSRMNNLSGVLVYKESSAPRGVTVNPGEDVTFTVVIKNLSNATKTVSVTETKPAELSYKTGSGTFDATVAPGETKRISYTLTVSASAAAGAVLDVQSNAFAVPLNKTEIRVANTLTASQQAGVTAALDALSAGSDYELARLYYKSAFLYNLPFTSLSDLYTKLFDSRVSGEKPYVTLKAGTSDVLKTVVPDVYGGVAYSKSDPDRPGYISDFNFVPGDLLVLYDDSTGANASIYVVTSERRFATIKNGVYTVTSSASETELLLETLMGRFAFAVLRPSLGSFENDGSSLFENDMLYEKNVVVFGDGFLTANNTGDVVRRFSEADGTALNVVSAKTFDNIEDGSGKYNLYELYNWNNTNITGHVDSAPVTRFFDVLSGSEGKIDYLWIETSRDDGTGNSSAPKTKITKAFTDLYGIASSGNAGIKISLINPAGFQDGTERSYASSYNPSGTRTGHNGLIHTMATT
ncbi:MAG: DUF11 domain-containing protein, partial [Clostridia bacterium]|nr:DUF11 domain-containing protein [Clostridia bacterium]